MAQTIRFVPGDKLPTSYDAAIANFIIAIQPESKKIKY